MRIIGVIFIALAAGFIIFSVGIMLGEEAYETDRYTQELEQRLYELEQQVSWEPPPIELPPAELPKPHFYVPEPVRMHELNYEPKYIDIEQSRRDRELFQIRMSLERIADALD